MTDDAGSQFPDLSVLAQVSRPAEFVEDRAPQLDGPPEATIKTEPETPPSRPRRGLRRDSSTRPPRKAETPAKSTRPSPRIVAEDDGPEIKEYRPGILVKPLRDLYTAVGTFTLPFNQPVGTAFIQNAEACAKALDDAARQDPRIRKALMSLIATSVWGQVIAAHMPILLALAMTVGPMRQALAPQPPDQQEGDDVVNPVSNGYARDTRPAPGVGR